VEYTSGAMADSSAISVRFRVASDQSLLVYFDAGQDETRGTNSDKDKAKPKTAAKSASVSRESVAGESSIAVHERVRRLVRLLEMEPVKGLRNVHPGYASVLVNFDALRLRHDEVQEVLGGYIERMEKVALPEAREVEIPVCYGGEYGPDLESVAELRGLKAERVIELHAEREYLVYFLGFVPGFAYLGELAEELVTPRLAAPRKSVPPGSVGIAKNHTGVYPVATPGGWRLLGRTPLKMFQPERAEMSLLAIGDRVRFVPISRREFARLERA
jgi:inhibitor of KinA